jgi:hypothetical protein
MKQILVPVSEFCRVAGIKKTLAFSLIKEKRVDSVKLGSRRLITVSSIEQLVQRLLEQTGPSKATPPGSQSGDA